MRDIRPDLRERKQAIRNERAQLAARGLVLDAEETALDALMQVEDERWKGLSAPQVEGPPREDEPIVDLSRSPLGDLVMDVLADGRPRSMHDLAQIAKNRGYPFGEKSPGRVVHFALVSLSKANRIEKVGSGLWRKRMAA